MNVIDAGQALRKQVAHPFAAFRGGVIKAFFLGNRFFLVILRKMRALSGELAISICSKEGGRSQPTIHKRRAALF